MINYIHITLDMPPRSRVTLMIFYFSIAILLGICVYFQRKKYRRWKIYKLLMKEGAKPAYTDSEIAEMERAEQAKAVQQDEENARRLKERIAKNAGRFNADGSLKLDNADGAEQKAQQAPKTDGA